MIILLSYFRCAWVEMELKHKKYKEALEVARRSIHRTSGDQGRGYHQRLMSRNVRLWSLCSDLEESFGTFATLKACYEKMFDSKIVTPLQVLTYTAYLEENKYWEESFRIYEKGIATLRWPHVYDVWMLYLAKFVARYGGRKLERARELFEQVSYEFIRFKKLNDSSRDEVVPNDLMFRH